jgi:CRISPR-associated protein Cmr6
MRSNKQENQFFIPLYNLGSSKPDIRVLMKEKGNAGLWYEKFCDQWDCRLSKNRKFIRKLALEGTGKQQWNNKIAKIGKVGDAEEIERAKYRLQQLVNKKKGKLIRMKTVSRFVPGMGRPNPVENGVNWHPTLGVPYLPGSSVKGVVRTWAEFYEENDPKDIQQIFGSDRTDSEQNENNRQAGSVIFFDAIPATPIQLVEDVMTPHFSKYYTDPGNISPREWENPIPIPFLAVDENQPFLFAVAPREEKNIKDVDKVVHWLKEAMSWTGAGAKTAVGYGRFEEIR